MPSSKVVTMVSISFEFLVARLLGKSDDASSSTANSPLPGTSLFAEDAGVSPSFSFAIQLLLGSSFSSGAAFPAEAFVSLVLTSRSDCGGAGLVYLYGSQEKMSFSRKQIQLGLVFSKCLMFRVAYHMHSGVFGACCDDASETDFL